MTVINQIRSYIIKPALKASNLWCESAEILLTGTLIMETNFRAIVQDGGPALGVFQIEPETHTSLKNYIRLTQHRQLQLDIINCCHFMSLPDDDELISNIKYSCLIARVLYLRNPESLPPPEDRVELANMYKKIYNTSGGKAKIDATIEIFKSIS